MGRCASGISPMRTDARLAKVAGQFSPSQAVRAWLTEAHAHGSLLAYLATLQDAPDSAFPLYRLQSQMEQVVLGRALRPRDRLPKTEQRERFQLAVRDVGMLYFLAINLNGWVREHHRANWLHVALVATMLRAGMDAEDESAFIPGWAQAQEALRTAYIEQEVVASIAQQYFGGQTPLFPD